VRVAGRVGLERERVREVAQALGQVAVGEPLLVPGLTHAQPVRGQARHHEHDLDRRQHVQSRQEEDLEGGEAQSQHGDRRQELVHEVAQLVVARGQQVRAQEAWQQFPLGDVRDPARKLGRRRIAKAPSLGSEGPAIRRAIQRCVAVVGSKPVEVEAQLLRPRG
jgi:hypothetical protein